VIVIFSGTQPCFFQRRLDAIQAFLRIAHQPMHFQRFRHNLQDRRAGVERFVGILKDHLRTLAQALNMIV